MDNPGFLELAETATNTTNLTSTPLKVSEESSFNTNKEPERSPAQKLADSKTFALLVALSLIAIVVSLYIVTETDLIIKHPMFSNTSKWHFKQSEEEILTNDKALDDFIEDSDLAFVAFKPRDKKFCSKFTKAIKDAIKGSNCWVSYGEVNYESAPSNTELYKPEAAKGKKNNFAVLFQEGSKKAVFLKGENDLGQKLKDELKKVCNK